MFLDKGVVLTYFKQGQGHSNSSSNDINPILKSCTIRLKDNLSKDNGFVFFYKEINRNKYMVLIQIKKIPNKNYYSIVTAYTSIDNNSLLYSLIRELIYNADYYQSVEYLQKKSSSIRMEHSLDFKKQYIGEKDYKNISFLHQLFMYRFLCNETLTLDILHSVKYFNNIENLFISNLPENELKLILEECDLTHTLNQRNTYKVKETLLREILNQENKQLNNICETYIRNYKESKNTNKVIIKFTYEDIHELFYKKDEDAIYYVVNFYQYLEEDRFNILELHEILEKIYDREWKDIKIKEYIENKIVNMYRNNEYTHIGRSSKSLPSIIINNFLNLSDNKKSKIANSSLNEIFLESMLQVFNHSFASPTDNNVINILESISELNKFFLSKNTIKIIKILNINIISRCINLLKGARYG